MKRRRAVFLGGTLAALLISATTAAVALPSEPPKAHVRHGGERIQRAHLAASCWPNEDGAMGCSEESPMTWPRRDVIEPGDRVRVRLQWKREPGRVFVDSFRSIGEDGRAEGRGKDVYSFRRPVRRDGEIVAWDVLFRLHVERVHYVRVLVRYPQTAAYNAHLEVVDQS